MSRLEVIYIEQKNRKMQTAKALRLKGEGFNPGELKDKSNGVDGYSWPLVVMESKKSYVLLTQIL